MHEQSETIQRPDKKWINVYGKGLPKAGQQLPGTPVYDSVDQAVSAAKQRSNRYTPEYKRYMQEVESHLKQVRRGVKVERPHPESPRLSQEAEMRRMGFPAMAQTGFAPPGTIASRRERLVQAPPEAQPEQKSPVWGFHEPTLKASEGFGQFLGKVGDVLSDPRNIWMGLGPLSAMQRPAGWGAEALRRYKLRGGTHETLDKVLKDRAVDREVRHDVVQGFRKGTDLAAPNFESNLGMIALQEQQRQFKLSGREFEKFGQRARGAALPIDVGPHMQKLYEELGQYIKSGARGNAAYNAVSRQMGRIMDQPGFGLRKGYHTEPPNTRTWEGLVKDTKRSVLDERGSWSPFGYRSKKPKPPPDSGGFRVPAKELTQKTSLSKPEFFDQVIGLNKYVDSFNSQNPQHVQDLIRLENVNPGLANDISETAMGKLRLNKLRQQAFDPAMETNPSPQVRRMFGFRQ